MRSILAAGLVAAVAFLPARAWAQAIDGSWCHQDGRRLSINGQDIVTPTGQRMQGQNSRQSFSYAPPRHAVRMRLVNPQTMHVSECESRAPEVWRRCDAPTS